MDSRILKLRGALVVAGAMAIVGVPGSVDAQRAQPRVAVGGAPQPRPPRIGHAGEQPSASQPADPRYHPDPRHRPDPRYQPDPRHRPGSSNDHARRPNHGGGTRVVYVPVPSGYGYGYPQPVYDGYGIYGSYGGYGRVSDSNGRPLSAPLEQAPAVGFSYTPDLSGSPYVVTDEGMMVVDFASAERRAFPSCAVQKDVRDPQGRPRTIFYQPNDYWMVLRAGHRGRVIGTPAAGTAACYAVDSVGRVVLRH